MMSEIGLDMVEEDWLRSMDGGIGKGVWRSKLAQTPRVGNLRRRLYRVDDDYLAYFFLGGAVEGP